MSQGILATADMPESEPPSGATTFYSWATDEHALTHTSASNKEAFDARVAPFQASKRDYPRHVGFIVPGTLRNSGLTMISSSIKSSDAAQESTRVPDEIDLCVINRLEE